MSRQKNCPQKLWHLFFSDRSFIGHRPKVPAFLSKSTVTRRLTAAEWSIDVLSLLKMLASIQGVVGNSRYPKSQS